MKEIQVPHRPSTVRKQNGSCGIFSAKIESFHQQRSFCKHNRSHVKRVCEAVMVKHAAAAAAALLPVSASFSSLHSNLG